MALAACLLGQQHARSQAADPLRSALAAHQYAEAVRLSQQQTKLHPDDPLIWTLQAMALNGDHHPQEALTSIQHALKVRPDFLPAAEAGAQIAYQAHDPRAQTMLDQVLRLEPGNRTAHAMAGVLALEQHSCAPAAAHFQQAGSLPQLDSSTSLRLAVCEAENGNAAGAMERLQALHTADPANTAITFDLASIDVDAGHFREALDVLKPLDSTSMDADTTLLLAAAYAGNEQVTEAIETYRGATARFPHDPRPYIDLAILSMDHQSPAVALGVLNAGIAANPKLAALYTMRGSIYAQIAKNDLAQTDFETADRLSPSEMSGTIGLGVLLRDQSNLDEAQQVLEAKLKQKPADPVLSYMLADVLIRKGSVPGDPQFQRAHALLETAIQRQPDLAQAHAALGKMELKAGQTVQAIAQLEEATRLDPRDRTALNQLVAAYRRSDRQADADRVATQLAKAVAEERAQETEKNRVHLIMDDPAAAARSASSAGPASP